ncbi:MAG: phage shock protein PspC (stress-responsive transcriptional regulator) [Patiriisocius sp.]|jgi:phage shock protein PspC (stress-responsive transcriptional regulator)
MKKTIAVNISGIIFNIEEDAYNQLKLYLSTIKGYFENSDSQEEIIDDIESRIAELFEDRVGPTKQVVTSNDVSDIIAIMGEPEDYLGEEDTEPRQAQANESYNQSSDKKLFRDKDQGIIGGVSVGLAAYFQIETVWIRLVWVIMVLFFGFGILPYVILWAIIPEAKTTSDKLRMRGDAVDIDSIKKKVNEGFEKLKYESENVGARAKGRGLGGLISALVDLVVGFLRVIIKFIGYFIGGLFIVIGIGLLVFLVGIFLDSGSLLGGIGLYPVTINDVKVGLFDSSVHGGMFLLGIVLCVGIPILAIAMVGLKMIFRFQWPFKGAGSILAVTWLIGLFLTILSSINLSSNFMYEDDISDSVNLHMSSDTLIVRLSEMPMIDNKVHINGLRLQNVDNGNVTAGNVYLDIIRKRGDKEFNLQIIKSSCGKDYDEIEEKIKNIEFEYSINENVLSINPKYNFPIEDKFRDQEVRFVLTVPDGKYIYMEDKVHLILDEIESDLRRSYRYFMDDYWIMSEDGLIDANDIETLPIEEVEDEPQLDI